MTLIKIKRHFQFILGLLLLAGNSVAQDNSFTIKGDLSSYYTDGTIEFIGYPPKGKSKAPAGGGMMAMGAASNVIEYAKGEVKKGKFKVSGTIDKPTVAYIQVHCKNKEGQMMTPTKGLNFILEPGNLEMTLGKRSSDFIMTGGDRQMNDKIFGYKKLDDYKQAQNAYYAAYNGYGEMNEENKEKASKEGQKYFNEFVDVEFAYRTNLAEKSTDKEILMLSLKSGAYGGAWSDVTRQSLINLSVTDPVIKGMIDQMIESNKRLAANQTFGIGSDIKYFYAKDLSGKAISLREVCEDKASKYVLLEFWASWCGPCRAEVPNMKKAYDKFTDKGFEIFSFTIDEKYDAWKKASEEEQLPWIDTGMGLNTGPKEMYGVSGVPANFLVDTQSGKIVAKNLRGTDLTKKLSELLDK